MLRDGARVTVCEQLLPRDIAWLSEIAWVGVDKPVGVSDREGGVRWLAL